MRNRKTLRITAAPVLAVIGTAILCGSLTASGPRPTSVDPSAAAPADAIVVAAPDHPAPNMATVSAHSGSEVEIAFAVKATGVSSYRWWAAEVVLAQAAATWILSTIVHRATYTTALSRRRRQHRDLNRSADMTPVSAAPMTTAATAPTIERRRKFFEA